MQGDVPDRAGELVAEKYRMVRLIGQGGMGHVWEGVHEKLRTRVAVKFIRPEFAENAEARTRFEIEARATAKLQSRHAVQVFDYGLLSDNTPYIVMEYLEGESLSDAVTTRGPLSIREVAILISEASRALGKAHELGIVHRDLKPDNIFLAKSDDAASGLPYVVKLVDFGIAKIFEDHAADGSPMGGPTREGTVIGTPNFMAPEQLTVGGAPGPLTDLWSLGACAYAAMTGRIPFEGDVLGEIVLRVCAAPMPIPSQVHEGVPPGFDAWFSRACARDPNRRFQSAEELAESLRGVAGIGAEHIVTMDEDQVRYVFRAKSSPPKTEDDDVRSSMSPRTALLAGLVLGLSLMVALVGFLSWRSEPLQEATPDAGVPQGTEGSASPSEASAEVRDAAPATVDAGKKGKR